MKKTIIIAGIIFIAGFILISCSKEDEKEAKAPSISLKKGTPAGINLPYVSVDTTIIADTWFYFGINAKSESEVGLKKLYIEGKFSGATPRVIDIQLGNQTVSIDTAIRAKATEGVEDFTITVWDKNDQKTSITIAITTQIAPSDIKVYENVILGDQENNVTGSFFASDEGMVYKQADAKINSERIDFLYYNDSVNFASIAAPNDTYAGVIYNNVTNGLQTWTTLNPTKFKVSSLTNNGFNQITTSAAIVTACNLPTTPNQTDINNLEALDILAFETALEVYGLMRVDEIITTGDNKTIKLTIKIQN